MWMWLWLWMQLWFFFEGLLLPYLFHRLITDPVSKCITPPYSNPGDFESPPLAINLFHDYSATVAQGGTEQHGAR